MEEGCEARKETGTERERDELHFYKEDMASPSRKLLPIYTIVTKLQVRQVFTTFSL